MALNRISLHGYVRTGTPTRSGDEWELRPARAVRTDCLGWLGPVGTVPKRQPGGPRHRVDRLPSHSHAGVRVAHADERILLTRRWIFAQPRDTHGLKLRNLFGTLSRFWVRQQRVIKCGIDENGRPYAKVRIMNLLGSCHNANWTRVTFSHEGVKRADFVGFERPAHNITRRPCTLTTFRRGTCQDGH
jgi:hypothetical protein